MRVKQLDSIVTAMEMLCSIKNVGVTVHLLTSIHLGNGGVGLLQQPETFRFVYSIQNPGWAAFMAMSKVSPRPGAPIPSAVAFVCKEPDHGNIRKAHSQQDVHNNYFQKHFRAFLFSAMTQLSTSIS